MIFDRRQFLEALPALGALRADAAGQGKTRFYVFEQYFLENGSQPARINEFFAKTLAPALERVHKGPKIFLDSLVTPHMPQVAVFLGVETLEQIYSVSRALFSDPDFNRAFDQWESGEPPYISASAMLLEATDYSPEIGPSGSQAKPRIFELRVYQSPTARQWKALQSRFAGAEIGIFHRSGVHPVLYSSTVFGPDRPNLTYLVPFDSLAAREKAWSTFAADPEWIKLRKESIEKHGQITSVQRVSFYRAAPYSPVR